MKAEVSPSTNRCWLRAPFNFSGELKALKNLSGTGFATNCGGDLHHRPISSPKRWDASPIDRPWPTDRLRPVTTVGLAEVKGGSGSIGGRYLGHLEDRAGTAVASPKCAAFFFRGSSRGLQHLIGQLGVGNSVRFPCPARARARRFRLRGHRVMPPTTSALTRSAASGTRSAAFLPATAMVCAPGWRHRGLSLPSHRLEHRLQGLSS